jgi:membrane-associated phospholipid phosphatase
MSTSTSPSATPSAIPPASSSGGVATADHQRLRDTWPLDRRDALHLAIAFVVTVGAFTALGWVVFDLAAPNALTRLDQDIAEWFVDQRTARGDDLAHWGAFLAATEVKIGATALFALFALWHWRRWPEPVFVIATLVFEASAFIIVTTIVGRERPDVPRLEDSPVNSSYPSGHVAAAAVYGAFAVVVFWNTRSKVARSLAVAAVLFVTAAVAWSRMYQGMHFASDVVAGIALGVVSLVVCAVVVGRPDAHMQVGSGETAP